MMMQFNLAHCHVTANSITAFAVTIDLQAQDKLAPQVALKVAKLSWNTIVIVRNPSAMPLHPCLRGCLSHHCAQIT